MDDCEKNNSKPIVHWVAAAETTEERFEVELLTIDFAVQLYNSAEEFLSKYDENSVGCVVLCRDNFGREESDLYHRIVHRNKIAQVILCLSSLDVPDVVRAIKLGFADVVRMHSDLEQIRASLQEATELEQTSRRGCVPTIHPEILSILNAEEVRIFQRLAEGVSNKQISVELGLSVRTIHYRKKIIFEKLRICTRIEAVDLIRSYRSGREHRSLVDSEKNNTNS